jgi:ribosome-binding protein aMBF1 (putative translation factor)
MLHYTKYFLQRELKISKIKTQMTTHQDWKPVVLTKKKSNAQESNQKPLQSKQPNIERRRLDNDESYVIPRVTLQMARKIIEGRTHLKMTQEQLAKRCFIPLAVLKEYEQGKGVYNRAYLDPICRVLNIVVSKPKQKQDKSQETSSE